MAIDTSWHYAFLRHVSDGNTYKNAATYAGVSDVTVYNHFHRFPELASAADAIRTARDRGPAPDTSWHAALVVLVANGVSIPTAAAVLDITVRKIEQQVAKNPDLKAAIDDARAKSGRRQGRRGVPGRKPRESTTMTDHAYEAEPTDVDAIVSSELSDFTDPLERYHRAGAAEALHSAAAHRFALERARTLAEMNDAGMSYQQIADVTLIGTRGRVQQLVEKARKNAVSKDARV